MWDMAISGLNRRLGHLQFGSQTLGFHHFELEYQAQAWTILTGWWFGTYFTFPYLGKNHPNWLSRIFEKGWLTNQMTMLDRIEIFAPYHGHAQVERRHAVHRIPSMRAGVRLGGLRSGGDPWASVESSRNFTWWVLLGKNMEKPRGQAGMISNDAAMLPLILCEVALYNLVNSIVFLYGLRWI